MILSKVHLLVLCICLSGTIYAQTSKCKEFKNGRFKSTVNGITAIIERLGNKQVERIINTNDTLTMVFDVKWVDDCTYILTPTRASLKKFPNIPQNATITVAIIKVLSNAYIEKEYSNFSNKSITSEMIRLSD